MKRFYLISVLIILLQSIIYSQNLRIDHVITVVNDLDSAIRIFEKEGFNVKPGKLHKNGLINAHIKFENGSSYELMSLQGEAKDDMAKNYEELLNKGEGGVYMALSGLSTSKITKKLNDLSFKYEVIKGKAWDYVILPDFPNLFFIIYHIDIQENKVYYSHKNEAVQISDVVIEGNEKLAYLLKAFGLKLKTGKTYKKIVKFKTKTGVITIVNDDAIGERPGLRSITFTTEDHNMNFTYFLLRE